MKSRRQMKLLPIPTHYPDEEGVNTGNVLWMLNSLKSINGISPKPPLECQAHKDVRGDIPPKNPGLWLLPPVYNSLLSLANLFLNLHQEDTTL
jgi:hypothetical protein